MNKNNIFKGITWLTIGTLLAKVFGGIYKIMLTRILGAENIGRYQQIFPIYTFLVVLITAGVPLGISKLLIKRKDGKEKLKILKSTLKIFLIFSVLIAIVLCIISNRLAKANGNEELTICYILLSPAIIFSALSAVLKGYFQSEENFRPTAISQICEQLTKIVIGLSASLMFAKFGFVAQISGAVLGVAVGDMIVLVVLWKTFKKKELLFPKNKLKSYDLKELLRIVFPIMLASLILPFSHLIDSLLVVKLLNNNFSHETSTYLYGLQTGVVGSLINFPTLIVFAIASVLLPTLSVDFQHNNEKSFSKKMSIAIKIILIFAIPCSLFVLFYPSNIIDLLFSGQLSGFSINGEMLSAKLLFWSAFNIVFLCMSQFLSICLQARDHRYLPALNNFIGICVKLLLEILFIPKTRLNILAFTLSSAIGYFTIFALNLYEILKENVLKIEKRFWIKLFVSNTLTIVISMILMSISSSTVNFVLVCLLSVVVYLVIIIQTKSLSKMDISYLFRNNIV